MCTAAATYSFVSSFFWYHCLNCQFQPVLVKDEEQRQQRKKSGNSVANGRGGSDGNDPDPVGIVDSSSSTPVARPQATSWNQTRKLIKEDFSRNNSDGMIDWSYKDSPEFQHSHQGTPLIFVYAQDTNRPSENVVVSFFESIETIWRSPFSKGKWCSESQVLPWKCFWIEKEAPDLRVVHRMWIYRFEACDPWL